MFFPSLEKEVAQIPFNEPNINPIAAPPRYKYKGRLKYCVMSIVARATLASLISGMAIKAIVMIKGATRLDNMQFEK